MGPQVFFPGAPRTTDRGGPRAIPKKIVKERPEGSGHNRFTGSNQEGPWRKSGESFVGGTDLPTRPDKKKKAARGFPKVLFGRGRGQFVVHSAGI